MSDCIFCKIANGEIPSATLYEDEDFRVILDLGPASKGHALILPKAHAANIYEISDDMAAKAFHFHMHLIPRYEGDQVGITWKPGTLTDEVKNEILEKLKSC